MPDNTIDLIFATSNKNKLLEVQDMLQALPIQLQSLSDIGWDTEIEETGKTLEENATIKARTIHEATGMNVFAEDTGLEVYSLNMAPGVYTARYAGPGNDALQNMNKLLSALNGISDRRAQFRTAITLIWKDTSYQFEGICRGNISEAIIGNGGFGYDPIFQPEDYAETFGTLDQRIKNAISHRYRALQAMIDAFRDGTIK